MLTSVSPLSSALPCEAMMYYGTNASNVMALSEFDYYNMCEIGYYTDMAFRNASSASIATEETYNVAYDSSDVTTFNFEPSWFAWSCTSVRVDCRALWYDDNDWLPFSTLSFGPDSFDRYWSIDRDSFYCSSSPDNMASVGLVDESDDWLPYDEWITSTWLQELHSRRDIRSRPSRAAADAMSASHERKMKELQNIENWPSLAAARCV